MDHKNNQGSNLIFLISQPRSGSTLTQRILGTHSQIHTQSEPWIMLHPLNALKSNNVHTAYDMDLYIKGAKDFINHLPAKETFYIDIISEAYQSLYNSILDQNKKNLFLDKTPRYYYIIEELSDYFPKARFIFLWRNPAAVLSSIVKTWSKADWYRLSELKDDLLFAPQWILRGISHLKDRAIVLKYEDLLKNPAAIIKKTCSFLSVPFEENIIEYGKFKLPDWQLGDQDTVYQKEKPDISHANTWITYLNQPQMWRVISDYINYLGSELVSKMGYDFHEVEGLLEQNKPAIDIHKHTLPLNDLLNTNRSILIENKRLNKDLRNALDGLRNRDENLRMRNETIAQKDRLIAEKERNIQHLKAEISKIQVSLEEKSSLINKQQTLISQKDKQIEKFMTDIGLFTKNLSEKDLLIDKRNNEIASLKLSLKEKEYHAEQLGTEVTSLKLSLKEKESHTEQLVEEVTSLKLSMKEKESQFAKMSSMIAAQKQELELNKSHNKKLQNQLSGLLEKSKAAEESEFRLIKDKKILQNDITIAKENASQLHETIHAQKKQIQELEELIKSIEQSYTFRIGKTIIWPASILKQAFTKTNQAAK